jgi:hypothetical protein
MARDFIKVDASKTTATYAAELLRYKELLRQAYDQGKKVLAVMGHLNDGSNFADIELLFGLAAGTGQTVFDLINGSVGSMEGTFQVSDAKTITERLGAGQTP